jgi:hypothetical protein
MRRSGSADAMRDGLKASEPGQGWRLAPGMQIPLKSSPVFRPASEPAVEPVILHSRDDVP